ncbi:MAG: MATE family efflux transporter [Oscillospiraceae bacterium]|nr:MATE family efflux transporter [Oscillospiraceae bacterium]
MAKTVNLDMCQGPLFGKIIRYTIPIILTNLLQLLFNAADLVVVGRYCGSISVAAVGATASIINLITNLFIGLAVGAGVVVAQGLGAGKDDEVQKTIHTSIPAALISGIILTVVGICCAKTFLAWMGTPDNVIGLSTTYMRVYFFGITSTLVYNYGAAILRAAGDTKSPLIFLLISGVVNVALNIFFVTVCHMNVAGVALATAISQTLSAVLVMWVLMRRNDACRFVISKMKIYPHQLKRIMRVGLPAGIQGSLFAISNVIIQSSINSFDSEIIISGNSAAMSIESFIFVMMNAFHQTALNFTGQNYGAGKFHRLNRILWLCLACVAVLGLVCGAGLYLLGRPLLSIYITDSAEAIEYGILRMKFMCLSFFLCGMMDVVTGAIRGMGKSLFPMAITILGVCGIRILWVYTVFQVPEMHTLNWLFISYPISWIITFLAELFCFMGIRRGQNKILRTAET